MRRHSTLRISVLLSVVIYSCSNITCSLTLGHVGDRQTQSLRSHQSTSEPAYTPPIDHKTRCPSTKDYRGGIHALFTHFLFICFPQEVHSPPGPLLVTITYVILAKESGSEYV